MTIRANRKNGGFVTLVVMTLLFMMVALLMVNTASLNRLRREMRETETKQAQRFGAVTNRPASGKMLLK